MEIQEIENIEKKDVNNVTFFFYFLNNTEDDDLYFFTKEKYNLKTPNIISKEELSGSSVVTSNVEVEGHASLVVYSTL